MGHKKTVSMDLSTKREEVEEGEKARPAKRLRARKRSSVSVLAHDGPEVNRDDAMDVDIKDKERSSPAPKVHPSPPKSPRRAPVATKPRTKSKPVSSSPKPPSKGRTVQKSPLSASFTAGSSTDVANSAPPPPVSLSSKERPSTPTKKRTRAQIVEVEILTRSPSAASMNGLKKKASVGSLKAGAGSKKKGEKSQDGRLRQKKMGEVIETSVDGEEEWS